VNTRTKERLASTAAAFRMVWLVLLYVFVMRCRIHFGHWPSGADGMAKYIGFTFHHTLAAYTLLASPFIALAVLIASIVFRQKDSRFRIVRPLAILAGSVLLCVAVSMIDPGKFILWFVD
jgi:hypothetical protein